MKSISFRFAVLTLLAVAAVGCNPTQAQDQTAQPAPIQPAAIQPAAIQPAAIDVTGLPPGIPPGSQTAEVMKLVQAGLDSSVINAYIANAPNAFNLDADQIITLKDAGVPSTSINAMMDHDRNIAANSAPAPAVTPPAMSPAPDNTPPPSDVSTTPVAYPSPDVSTVNVSDTAPPPPVTIDYFNQSLDGYGSWIVVPGYGRCWRPTTVLYDPNWRPYCDGGHWVYTDCGWYWASDYSWGATFHYGRWFHHPGFGWCWYPDLEWAPSWVSWRSSDDYCGWAPLPPFAVYRPREGFFYRGTVVSVDFDFGLRDDVFIFVDHDHFCDRHPREFCLDRDHGRDAYRHTDIINHFDDRDDVHGDHHDRVVVNAGIPVEKVRPHDGHEIHPVAVGALADARREGWRGTVVVPQHTGPGFPGHNATRTGSQPQDGLNATGNNGNSHTFNNNNNQGVTRFNNNNNPGLNNNNPQHNHDNHSGNQGQFGGSTFNNNGNNTSAIHTGSNPGLNNSNPQNNHENHSGNQGQFGGSTFNNNGNNTGVIHTGNNPGLNNNNPQNNHDSHSGNQGQFGGSTFNNNGNNPGAIHTGNNPGLNNNNTQNNHSGNQNQNANHTFNNTFNNPGGMHQNNQGVNNNNNPQNNQAYHVVSQSPNAANSSAHYTSPTPTTPAANNTTQPNHTVNPAYNYNYNNHSGQSERILTPGNGSMNQHSQPQYQVPQNAYQPRNYNNNNINPTVPTQPRVQYTPPAPTPPPQPHVSAPAYTAPAHNNSQSSGGNSGSSQGGQSHGSGNNGNQQQNH